MSGDRVRERALADTERWFVSRGIPHFIDGYSASRDVFTRAAPVLTLVVVVEVVVALNFSWPWWLNVSAAVGGLAVLIAAWGLTNALRRRRPLFGRPGRIGPVELVLFVIAPAALPVLFGDQRASALATAGTNAGLLVAVYAVTSYGVVPLTLWAAGRLWRQVGAVFGLLVRALPLLLLFVTFLFVNAEVWQVAAGLTGPFLAATLGLFAVIGTVFLVTRVPREVSQLNTFDSWVEVTDGVCGTPAEVLAEVSPPPLSPPLSPRLSRREWGNVGLVVVFSQGLQVVLVGTMMAAFFVVFGLLTITPAVIQSWTGQAVHELATVTLWGRPVLLTEELLRVTAFLGAFSCLYFAVYAITDTTYRQEFFDELVGEVREALAVRAVYRAAKSSTI